MPKKNVEYRLRELETSLDLIAFSVDQVFDDLKEMHFITIQTQLRALIGMGGRNMHPLLLDLSDQLKIPLIIHSFPPQDTQDMSNLAFDVPYNFTWTVEPMSHRYTFREWLNLPDYFTWEWGEYKSRNMILRDISDKNATHYDSDVGILFEFMNEHFSYAPVPNSNNVPVPLTAVSRFLLELAYATLWLGFTLIYKYRGEDEKLNHIEKVTKEAILPFNLHQYRFQIKKNS